MKALIAWPLALGIGLAAPMPAYAGQVHHYRAIHHRSLAIRAQAPASVRIFVPAQSPTFGDKETDGLSRNPNDCATYGCIDSGG